MSSYTSSLNTTVVNLTNINQIDSLISSVKWKGVLDTGLSFSYSFPWTSNETALWQEPYSLHNQPFATNVFGLSSDQISAASGALQSWANVANINFTQLAETGTEVGDFRFAFSSGVPSEFPAWAYKPNSYWARSADVWIHPDLKNSDFSIGNRSYQVLIHEIGHGLGLKHPGNYSGSEQGPFLPADLDNKLYTVMSYNHQNIRTWTDTQTNLSITPRASTPMVLDIAAIQHLYGANTSYRAGNDVYSFDNRAPFMETIWDAGGHDTISVEYSSRASLIDLTPGSYSNIQTNRIVDINTTNSTSYNLGIAYGTIIEDAIGGSANDRLIGNNADNLLNGGAGDDQLTGGGGNDILTGGGSGKDTFVYQASSNGIDTITDFTYGDVIRITGATFTTNFFGNNSTTLGANQIYFDNSGTTTIIHIGTDSNAGSDITIKLNRSLSIDWLSASSDALTLNTNHASSFLNNLGVTMQGARDFIFANVNSPKTIYDVCLNAHVTTEILAEILSSNNISQDQIIGFFTANGLNPASLDMFA